MGTYYENGNYTGYYNGYSYEPKTVKLDATPDGAILVYSGDFYLIHKPDADHFYSEDKQWIPNVKTYDAAKLWLYSETSQSDVTPPEGGDEGGNEGGNEGGSTDSLYVSKKALYDILNEGIKYNYASYERAAYEKLLDALDAGITVYKKDGVTEAELTAATNAIRTAINALKLDVKKINGTLFKYGYNNSTGTVDYTDGGFLMNDISVRQMKTAILANPDLVSQIKDVIGYDDPNMGWTGNKADEALDEAVELYAKVYTLMFTGTPVNGLPYDYNQSPVNPSAENQDLTGYVKIPLTLGTYGQRQTHTVQMTPMTGKAIRYMTVHPFRALQVQRLKKVW